MYKMVDGLVHPEVGAVDVDVDETETEEEVEDLVDEVVPTLFTIFADGSAAARLPADLTAALAEVFVVVFTEVFTEVFAVATGVVAFLDEVVVCFTLVFSVDLVVVVDLVEVVVDFFADVVDVAVARYLAFACEDSSEEMYEDTYEEPCAADLEVTIGLTVERLGLTE